MCNSTEQLIRNQIFWAGESVKLILAVSGLIFNGIFIHILYRSSRNFDFSYNCSILINISISYIFLTFGSLCRSIFTFWAVLSEHWCWIGVPYYALCQFQVAVYLVGQLPALLSFGLLTIERLRAKFALDAKNDRQHHSWNCFFDTCLILSWGVSLTAALIVGLTIDQNQKAPYCSGLLLMDARLILGTATVVPAFFVLFTALYVILWYKTNRKLKTLVQSTNAALDDRLQIQQNFDVTSMSLPSLLIHSCLHLAIILSVTLLRRWPPTIVPLFRRPSPPWIDDFGDDNPQSDDFTSIIASQFTVYGSTLLFLNAHPLLCLWFSGRILGDQCRRVLPFTEKLWRSRLHTRDKGAAQEEEELDGEQRRPMMADWSPFHSLNRANNNEEKRRGARSPASKLLVRNASPGTIYGSEEMMPTSSSHGQWM